MNGLQSSIEYEVEVSDTVRSPLGAGVDPTANSATFTSLSSDLSISSVDYPVLAHGANPKLIGRNLFNLKDTDGKYLIRELIDAAKAGSGWVDYKWSHPKSKKIMPKTAFVKKIDNGLWIGCGTYLQ